MGRFGKLLMAIVAGAMALAFFAPPVVKLKDPAMIAVLLIGVAGMVYGFVEFVREKDE